MNKLLDTKEVAEMLRVSSHAVRSWVQKGQIPYLRIGGGRLVRFQEQKIREWIETRRCNPD